MQGSPAIGGDAADCAKIRGLPQSHTGTGQFSARARQSSAKMAETPCSQRALLSPSPAIETILLNSCLGSQPSNAAACLTTWPPALHQAARCVGTHHRGLSPARGASEQSPPGALQALPKSTQSGAALKAVLSAVDPQLQAPQAVVLCRGVTALHRAQTAKVVEYATSLGFSVTELPTVPR